LSIGVFELMRLVGNDDLKGREGWRKGGREDVRKEMIHRCKVSPFLPPFTPPSFPAYPVSPLLNPACIPQSDCQIVRQYHHEAIDRVRTFFHHTHIPFLQPVLPSLPSALHPLQQGDLPLVAEGGWDDDEGGKEGAIEGEDADGLQRLSEAHLVA